MNEVLVLCYHGVSETWPAATTVAPGDFEEQISSLVARGYKGATLCEALTTPASAKTLVVTFDDAHRSVLELAAPVLERLGVPGTMFVPTDYPDSGRPMAWDGYAEWMGTEHEGELDCMGWDDLRGLAEGGWEIGSHTRSHPRLSRLGDAEILAELVESRAVCEKEMRTPCRSLAYPYSDYDDRVVRAAREAGYLLAVTVPRGPQAPLPLQWPRVGVYCGEGSRRVIARSGARRLAPSLLARTALAVRRRRP
jgi:peptidoglycan/xylan/chitin deacetylase (PgdA/CDA1 family)